MFGEPRSRLFCSAYEKFLIDDHDDPGQQQLDKTHGDVVAVKPAWQRPAPHHMAHREIHQNEQKCGRGDQPLFKMRRLPVLQRALRPPQERPPARAQTRRSPASLTALMTAAGSAVPSTPIEFVSRLTAQDVTPGTFLTAFFHTGAASGAVHAGHGILLHENPSLGIRT